MSRFERLVITLLPDEYIDNFGEWFFLVGSLAPSLDVARAFREVGKDDAIVTVLDPCVEYILAMRDSLVGKQACYRHPSEAFLMAADFPEMASLPTTKEDYTAIITFFCDAATHELMPAMKQGIAHGGDGRVEASLERQAKLLRIASSLSPWNHLVWMQLMSKSGYTQQFFECAHMALRYCTREESPYGLGDIYANIASHIAVPLEAPDRQTIRLISALSALAERYGGSTEPLHLLLAARGNAVTPMSIEQAIPIVRSAGYQFGFSDIVLRMRSAEGESV